MDAAKPRNPRYVAVLAVVSCLVLAGGWLARPRDVPQSPPPLPSETELEQLARRAERRSLDSMAKYFTGIAREAAPSIVHLQSTASSGAVWDEQRVVTWPLQGQAQPGAITVTTASGSVGGQPSLFGPNLPLTVLTIPRGLSGVTPARRAAALPHPGDWVLAVWRADTEPGLAPGSFRQVTSIRCGDLTVQEIVSSLAFTSTMTGGGLFDIDGDLLAVMLPCGARIAAVAIASIEAILGRGATTEQGLQGRYGLRVGRLSPDEQRYFKIADGLLVREVWTGHAGDVAGFRPGDIMTAINGERVSEIDELRKLTEPLSAPVDVSIQRRSKPVTITLPATPAGLGSGSGDGDAGLTMEPSPRTYRIGAVRPGSRAALAGIEAGDRLVTIDRVEPRNLDQVRRLIGTDQPSAIWLEIERDGRRLGVLVQGA